jgi:hypothetical protein
MDAYYDPENLGSRFPMDMKTLVSGVIYDCLRVLGHMNTEMRLRKSADKDLSEALRLIRNFVCIGLRHATKLIDSAPMTVWRTLRDFGSCC